MNPKRLPAVRIVSSRNRPFMFAVTVAQFQFIIPRLLRSQSKQSGGKTNVFRAVEDLFLPGVERTTATGTARNEHMGGPETVDNKDRGYWKGLFSKKDEVFLSCFERATARAILKVSVAILNRILWNNDTIRAGRKDSRNVSSEDFFSSPTWNLTKGHCENDIFVTFATLHTEMKAIGTDNQKFSIKST